MMKCCKPSWLKFQGFWTADLWRQWAATQSNLNRSHQIIYCYWEQIQVCPLDLLARKIAIYTATAVATSCTSWVHVRHILEGLAIRVCVNATKKSKVDEASSKLGNRRSSIDCRRKCPSRKTVGRQSYWCLSRKGRVCQISKGSDEFDSCYKTSNDHASLKDRGTLKSRKPNIFVPKLWKDFFD